MARNQSAFRNWAEYLALRTADAGLQMFSPQRNLKSASALGSLWYRYIRKHRQRAIENISAAMPELSPPRVREIAEQSIQGFLHLGVEVLFTTRNITLDSWSDHIRFDRLEPALDLVLSRRPTILVTGHYGNWEVLGYLMALLGINLSAIARPIDNPLINDWLLGIRERKGLKIITKWDATQTMVDVMEAGGTLGFIADQNAGDKGMFVPFFDRLASTYKSIGLLAIRFDAPVLCGYARRIGTDFKFEVGVNDIIYPEDWKKQPDPLYYLTARYNRALEQMVREVPEQYLWIHRRWKSRPRHERDNKPIPAGLRHQLQSLPWMTPELMSKLEFPGGGASAPPAPLVGAAPQT
jgi:KDO2-lipid IV(A) lauroyltransferase